ncbi:hypothetical protein CRG98_031304 [Punica granatum]|uniref:Uncharacterized protein n=1 Tax=Punica granatum TaxID=22663 RepID=A0A2I0IWF5_PUNGR|nr:hypothetical protein CRG98_031304 [Punica granatum]
MPARLKAARARWLANFRCRKVHSNGLADPARLQEARARKVNSHGLENPARLQEARARSLGELAVQESNLARISRPGKTRQGYKRHEGGGSANLRCKKVISHGLADPARLQEARGRWFSELAVQESNLARISRPGKTRQGYKRHEGGGSANLRCKKVISHGLADPARLQEARGRWFSELAVQESNLARISRPGKTRQGYKRHEGGGSANLRCKKVISHGLADPARLQEARGRWFSELAVQESNLARISRPGKTRQGYKRHEGGGSANLRCKKVISHGLADPARLQEARGRWFSELAVQESNLARISRPGKTRQGYKRHEGGGSANLRCKKVISHGLADPARLQEARGRWFSELAVQESNLARISRPGKTRQGYKRHEGGGSANLRCKKVISHGLADPARLQEARGRWFSELAVQESNLARISRPGKTRQGYKRHEGGGSANLRCKKVISHGLADPARLQEARGRWFSELAVQESNLARISRPGKTRQGYKRHEGGGSANLRCKKVISHGLADPARLKEARVRWLGELGMQEMKLSRFSRPGKVARVTSETQQSYKRHERGGSANLRCQKLSSHGLLDPVMLQEARAKWLGELAVPEIKLARVTRPRNVARGTSEVARRTCGARN